MRKAWPVAAALLLSCAPVARYKPKGELVPYQGFHARLPSGMQVVVYEVPQVDRFSLTVSYGSGSTEDPQGKEGLAHLAEHLAFRCAPAGSGGVPLWDQLTAAGWRFNASTDWDSTDYHEVGKPDELAGALRVEAARMRDPTAGVDEDTFAVERDVVLSEYRERLETNLQGAQIQWILEGAFPDHPLGRPVGGTPESLRRISLAEARAWMKERYRPANAVAVIVSPFPSREVVRQLVEAFGDLAVPAGPDQAPMVRPTPPPPPSPGKAAPIAVKKAPVRQPVVWVAWPVPGLGERRDPQGEAAARALEKAFSGVLLRNYGSSAFAKVDGWRAFYWPVGDRGLVVLSADLVSGGDAERVADLARSAALELVLSDEPGQSTQLDALTERERKLTVVETRDQLLVDAYLEIEDLDGAEVARFLRATGEPDYLGGRRKNIVAVLNADISTYAAENLKRERSVAVLVLPDQNALASGLMGARSVSTQDRDDLEDGTWVPPGPDRVRAVARPPGFAAVARRVLPNGLTVLLARRGTLPVAEVRLLLRTSAVGTPGLPAGVPGFALATNTNKFSGVEAARVGADAWVAVGRETVLRATRGTSANLEVLLESTAEWARDQRVRYYSELKDAYLRSVERLERDPEVLAVNELLAGAFPGHPYSAPTTAAALKGAGEAALAGYLRREFRPERATLVVASNQPESPELWAAVERFFGGWARGDSERVEAPPVPPPERKITLVDRPGATQAVIGLALRVPPLAARDRAATDAVAWLAENRLMQRLRVEQGVTYGARVFLLDPLKAGALIVFAAVDRAAASSSLTTLLATHRGLAQGGVTPAEAGRARWQVARRYASAFDTVGEAIEALQGAAEHGLPPESWDAEAGSIAALDAARIKAAAALMPVGKESVVVLGDASLLGPQLTAAGFAPRVVKP
jgi:zinc protease